MKNLVKLILVLCVCFGTQVFANEFILKAGSCTAHQTGGQYCDYAREDFFPIEQYPGCYPLCNESNVDLRILWDTGGLENLNTAMAYFTRTMDPFRLTIVYTNDYSHVVWDGPIKPNVGLKFWTDDRGQFHMSSWA